MLSKASNVMAVLAIILAPIFAFLLPDSVTEQLVLADVELKDAVLLISLALVVIALYLAHLVRIGSNWIATGPFYRRIDFNYIYLADGTFLSRNAFEYINGWKPADQLPREDLIWHKRITKSDLLYRFYERGTLRDRSMSSSEVTRIEAIPKATGERSGDFRYSWIPTVLPRLSVKERISFVVEIMSMRTETAAFTRGGTKMGFGINTRTARACLKAHAPFGFRFVLLEPALTIRKSDTLEEVAVVKSAQPEPMISPDGSLLTLEVNRPLFGKRYWIHYRFEELDR
jgi:hypothetical protein